MLWISPFAVETTGLSWERTWTGAHDSSCVIDDWAKLDEFIAELPDPEQDPQFKALAAQAATARARDRYLLAGGVYSLSGPGGCGACRIS